MSKLDVHELVVSSFATGPSFDVDIPSPHPTPATFCRVCPPYEQEPATGADAQEITL